MGELMSNKNCNPSLIFLGWVRNFAGAINTSAYFAKRKLGQACFVWSRLYYRMLCYIMLCYVTLG